MTKPPQPLDDAFWARFSKTYWERKPVAVQRVASPLLAIGPQDIFQLLVRYSDRCRETQTLEGLKFYVEGQPLFHDEVFSVLPVEGDRSLQGYHARLLRQFSDYCLVCDELMQVSLEKWDVLGAFMRNLYRHVGVPNRYAEIGLYLGNYRKTPFGVHVDGCGVISIPVVGKKTFRLWDPRFVEKNPDLQEAHQYDAYKEQSTLLEAGPGDITYWPSTYWHIAESDGAFSATWSIGTWLNQPHAETLLQTLKPLLARKLKSDGAARVIRFSKLHAKDGRVDQLPGILKRTISVLGRLSKSDLHDAFQRSWLQSVSRNGFKNAPLPAVDGLSAGDLVQGKPGNPILWSRLAGGGLCLAVNGELVELAHSAKVVKLIQALNAGTPCPAKADLKILTKLYRLGGVVKVSRAGGAPLQRKRSG